MGLCTSSTSVPIFFFLSQLLLYVLSCKRPPPELREVVELLWICVTFALRSMFHSKLSIGRTASIMEV